MIPKTIKGKVVKGRGIGKKFGVPTANIKLEKNYDIPKSGVFSGLVLLNKKKYKAAIFVGPRLTFNITEPVIEAAIIDFKNNLYDNKIELKIGKKIRDIKKFASLKDLKKQILKDIKYVKFHSDSNLFCSTSNNGKHVSSSL